MLRPWPRPRSRTAKRSRRPPRRDLAAPSRAPRSTRSRPEQAITPRANARTHAHALTDSRKERCTTADRFHDTARTLMRCTSAACGSARVRTTALPPRGARRLESVALKNANVPIEMGGQQLSLPSKPKVPTRTAHDALDGGARASKVILNSCRRLRVDDETSANGGVLWRGWAFKDGGPPG